jgi:hypothetical protein
VGQYDGLFYALGGHRIFHGHRHIYEYFDGLSCNYDHSHGYIFGWCGILFYGFLYYSVRMSLVKVYMGRNEKEEGEFFPMH